MEAWALVLGQQLEASLKASLRVQSELQVQEQVLHRASKEEFLQDHNNNKDRNSNKDHNSNNNKETKKTPQLNHNCQASLAHSLESQE